MNFPPEKDNWKIIEKNNLKGVLRVLNSKKENIYSSNVTKHNSNREKQGISLTIPNGEAKW